MTNIFARERRTVRSDGAWWDDVQGGAVVGVYRWPAAFVPQAWRDDVMELLMSLGVYDCRDSDYWVRGWWTLPWRTQIAQMARKAGRNGFLFQMQCAGRGLRIFYRLIRSRRPTPNVPESA